MFTIVSNTHRVTKYVIDEAHKWLYKEIEANKYSASKNRAARTLILHIRTERGLTDAQFLRNFLGSATGNTGVYLVENEGIHLILLC